MRKKKPRFIRNETFKRKGKYYAIQVNKTGNELPKPCRIRVFERYWDDTGGLRGWDWNLIYDRNFEDWNYARAVYDAILKKGDTSYAILK